VSLLSLAQTGICECPPLGCCTGIAFLWTTCHLSQFLQAAEPAVIPCNKKGIYMDWTGLCML